MFMQTMITREEHFLIFPISKKLYPFVYFDLTKQKMDIKDGVTKLSFHYGLSGATATDYIIYGVVLHEQEAKIEKEGEKLLLRG